MKRFAANYIACQSVDRLHYVEVTSGSVLNGVFPLEKELAGTSFLNGVIWVVPAALGWEVADVWSRLTAIHQQMPDASVPEMLKELIGTSAVPAVGEQIAIVEKSKLIQDSSNNEQLASDQAAVSIEDELPAFLESSILDQDGINNEQPATYLPVQGKSVSLFLIKGISLSAAEFGADNSSGNRYVEGL
ncbi:hypothetical protein [Macellibacteroides fermentans]|uniref:Uncharacterized protein n=1 Tax=Macellibacteroides fermentans TaxID=879969 RepID=A0A8E1ZZF4_9PORP|nr:hypothetical protein [Macellibacteroides fermentans]NYI51184.1 hypothetical protein [Macellibacteroides fermentans]